MREDKRALSYSICQRALEARIGLNRDIEIDFSFFSEV